MKLPSNLPATNIDGIFGWKLTHVIQQSVSRVMFGFCASKFLWLKLQIHIDPSWSHQFSWLLFVYVSIVKEKCSIKNKY